MMQSNRVVSRVLVIRKIGYEKQKTVQDHVCLLIAYDITPRAYHVYGNGNQL